MTIKAESPEEYVTKVPADRRDAFRQIRQAILDNILDGFEEGMQYGMIGYYVPHSIYPDGYHCNPKDPLPFANIANQKNYLALYHACCYADEELREWFVSEYSKVSQYKIDMGKSCIRFKRMNDIPYDLIGELMGKISCNEWIAIYEKQIKK